MERSKITEYGGIQGVLANGVKDGKGRARIAIYDIEAGEVIGKDDVIRTLIPDYENPSVPVMMTYELFTKETAYGFSDNPVSNNPGTHASNPTPKVVSEKEVFDVQRRVTEYHPEGKIKIEVPSSPKVVAEKNVYGVQESATGASPKA